MTVPSLDEIGKLPGQIRLVGKVSNSQAFPLKDAKPLLHLIHPRAVHRRVVEHEARVTGQPRLDLLALVHPEVVQDDVDLCLLRREFPVQLLQERDELHLTLSIRCPSVDFAGSCVESGEKVQRALSLVLMLNTHRLVRLGRQRRAKSRTWLEARLLVNTQNHFLRAKWPSVQLDDVLNRRSESRIPRHLRREPHVVPPRFEPVMRKDTPDGLGRNRGNEPAEDQLPGKLGTIPLAQ